MSAVNILRGPTWAQKATYADPEDLETNSSLPFSVSLALCNKVSVHLAQEPHAVEGAECLIVSVDAKLRGASRDAQAALLAAGKSVKKQLREQLEQKRQSPSGDLRFHTGDVVKTKAGRLKHFRSIVHVVTPSFCSKYSTAIVSALSACVRNSLGLAAEEGCKSCALFGLSDSLEGENVRNDNFTHIVVRTLRRFFEKYPRALDHVAFVARSAEEFGAFEKVLPLYFPRCYEEARNATQELRGRDVGDADGNPYIEQRRIRISAEPKQLSSGDHPVSPTRKFGSGYPQMSSYSPVLEKNHTPIKITLARIKYKVCNSELITNEIDGSQYTAYHVRTSSGSSMPPAIVKRRYKQFRQLRDDLVVLTRDYGAYFTSTKLASLEFPPKYMWGNFDPEVVAERKAGLEKFLKCAHSALSNNRDGLRVLLQFCGRKLDTIEGESFVAEDGENDSSEVAPVRRFRDVTNENNVAGRGTTKRKQNAQGRFIKAHPRGGTGGSAEGNRFIGNEDL